MGVMDVPAGSDAMKNLSLYLKVEALVFISILPFAYTLKVGVAWHDAGPPLDITDVKFHPYWNMLLGLYTGLGVYQLFASFNPEKFKVLLSFSIYVMRFTHGVIALIACFSNFSPSYTGPSVIGELPATYMGFTNIDKLFVAVPIWLGTGSLMLYFCVKAFGSTLLPWDL